ncbi:MAG: GntR family transcriptional regulator [Anaerolineaceae bacterium]|nr:MAG: GntR family transcriptional regulator [Anaerolineaceae bacterium]
MSKLSTRRRSNPGSLANQIYEMLRSAIVRSEIAPGEKLVELEIAADMGTSQGPVREALQRLERDGLVQRQARRATVVTDTTTAEIYEFFAIRSTIESFAIRRAIANMTPEYEKMLRSLTEDMRRAGEAGDMAGLVEYDMDFHRLICEWSGSPVLVNAWMPLYSQIQRFILQTHQHYFTDLGELADTHEPILSAISRRDADAAAQIIAEHVMLIWSRFEKSQGEEGK